MGTQETQVDTIVAIVDASVASVTARATLSHPTSGGWSMALAGAFVKGGNAPEDVDLGKGSDVADKMLEVAVVMKNISATTTTMSLQVDVLGNSQTIAGDIAPGHSAHYSLFVAFVVLP